ncbi:MAG TPA: hypothetical protein VI341_03545 [Actinomycetota bacterium]
MSVGENGFGVQIREADDGWRVVILDDSGSVVSERTCRDRSEARVFASTVRQHIYWLSADRFRTYYRLGAVRPAGVS